MLVVKNNCFFQNISIGLYVLGKELDPICCNSCMVLSMYCVISMVYKSVDDGKLRSI